MNVAPNRYQGLVADLLPNHRLMEACGHFLFKFIEGPVLVRQIYSGVNVAIVFFQYVCMVRNLMDNTKSTAELTANSVTCLFFLHCLTKYLFVAFKRETFYRTWTMWNSANSHPVFAENDARHHSISLSKQRRLLMICMTVTIFSWVSWVTITFFGKSEKEWFDRELNETLIVDIPRLPLKALYPWNAMSGFWYYFSLVFQCYYLLMSLMQANLADVLFCSWLIFACEQLMHMKSILRPLMELSATLDTYRPNSGALFRNISAGSKSELIENEGTYKSLQK